jgi:MoaA/NifB/PqqE/SkfB family radical SAM enzyme
MSTEDAHAVAQHLIDARVLHVHFGGGEPLGRKDFLPIAGKIANSGATVTLSTNGSLLTEEVADALAGIPIETVAFSIHGSDATSHDAFNQFDGAWDRLVAAIHRMVERRVRVKLVSTLTKPVATHAARLVALAHEWGVYMLQFQTFKRHGNADLNISALEMTPEEWLSTYRSIQEAVARTQEVGSALKVDLGLDNDPVLAERLGLPASQKHCDCGVFSLTIKPNGDVMACAFTGRVLDNVHRTPLQEIWQTNQYLTSVRQGLVRPCATL